MMFKRMMVLGAVASALALAGCQDRGQQDQTGQPATGGSGMERDDYGGTKGTGGTGTDVRSPQGVPATEPSVGGADDDTGGSGTVGGSVDDQDSTVAPDGMDGTDNPPVEDNQLDDSLERDSVNR